MENNQHSKPVHKRQGKNTENKAKTVALSPVFNELDSAETLLQYLTQPSINQVIYLV